MLIVIIFVSIIWLIYKIIDLKYDAIFNQLSIELIHKTNLFRIKKLDKILSFIQTK